jgi:hypothetical protein
MILTAWAQIGRIKVHGQPGQTVCKIPFLKEPEKNGLEMRHKWYVTCFVSMKPCIQIPVPPLLPPKVLSNGWQHDSTGRLLCKQKAGKPCIETPVPPHKKIPSNSC